MKAFNRIFQTVAVALILLFAAVNMLLAAHRADAADYISRLVREIETNGSADIN